MCVKVCMSAFVFTYVCQGAHACPCMCMNVLRCAHVPVCMHTCVCVSGMDACLCKVINMPLCVPAFVHQVCMSVPVCACMCVCVKVYTCALVSALCAKACVLVCASMSA
jgi:hypothetical protein